MASISKLLSMAKKYNTKRNQNKVLKGISGLTNETRSEVSIIQKQIDSELSGIAKLERERNALLTEKQKKEQREKLQGEISELKESRRKGIFKEMGISTR